MTEPSFVTAAAVATSPAFDPDAAAPPRYTAGPPFDTLDVRPGRVLLLGAPPAAGKTALTLQLATAVLHAHADVKAVIANVEMTAADLLARVAARLAGVKVGTIRDKTYDASEKAKVRAALAAHNTMLGRLAFLEPPFTLEHLACAADTFGATLLVVDYLQRLGHGGDLRETLDGLMTGVRALALGGAAVVAVSSVSRQKDEKGRSGYSGLNMASFRGSAELEFGADSAYLLDAAAGGVATVRCVKNRYGEPADVRLRFDGAYQRFDPADPADPPDAYDAAPGAATTGITR
jgi:replicative DNA helicase